MSGLLLVLVTLMIAASSAERSNEAQFAEYYSKLGRLKDAESIVLYGTITGDLYNYMSKKSDDGAHKAGLLENAWNAYNQAYRAWPYATTILKPLNPLRLDLALKLSALQREVKEDTYGACHIAVQDFNDAKHELHLGKDSYEKSTSILKLLKDNISEWRCREDYHMGVSTR